MSLQSAQHDSTDIATLASTAARKAAEWTARLNPLCVPLQVKDVDVSISYKGPDVVIRVTVLAAGEKVPKIEAMFASAAASVTIWDMALAIARKNEIPCSHFCFECSPAERM